MKLLKINGVHIEVATDEEAARYPGVTLFKLFPSDNWGIATSLNRGELLKLTTGYDKNDGEIDFAVPEDWAAHHPDERQWTVWSYKKNHVFGEPLDMSKLFGRLRRKIVAELLKDSDDCPECRERG